MTYLPEELRVEIVRRVGRDGFRELGQFISSGRAWRDAAFSKEVLREVDIDEYIFVSSLANEGSIYRPFFVKCLNEGNITAKYVEGLRRAVKYGPSRESLELMKGGEEGIPYAVFAAGVFLICNGYYEEGMGALVMLSKQVSWLDAMVEIADMVMAQIADIQPPMVGNYAQTYKYPHGDIPNCVHFACTPDDVCFDCIGYFYSRRIVEMC